MKSGKLIPLLFLLISAIKSEKECKCGWKNPSRIVGGLETGVNEFPMMASIIYLPRGNFIFCGGTIITHRHILTAAHCFLPFQKNKNPLSLVRVVVGEHDIRTNIESNATQRYEIETVTIHPKFYTGHNDVAIVKTKDKIDYSMRVGPICLPFNYMKQDFVNETVTAVGWGRTSFNGPNSAVLRKVDLHVIGTRDCKKYFNKIDNNVICTYDVEKDACVNDSGGPILWTSPTTNNLIIVGIISYGRKCAEVAPGVNTRVTSYMNFIQNTIDDETYCKAN